MKFSAFVWSGFTIICIAFSGPAQVASWRVGNAGAMRAMFESGDISGKTKIAELPQKHLFAVGPLAELGGEITILDGKVFVSRVDAGRVVVESNPAPSAVFFVWANVRHWRKTVVPAGVRTYDELEAYVEKAAKDGGIDTSQPFPFRLRGVFGKVEWHVNDYKPDGSKLTRAKHDAAKFKSTSENARLEMVGFYSRNHKGVFTHHTRLSHVHVTDRKRSFVAHVDDLVAGNRLTLYLPR